VHMYMYIYMYIVYVHVYIHMYIYVCIYMYTYMCMHKCLYMYVCIYIYDIYIHIRIYRYKYIYINAYIYIYICIYIYVTHINLIILFFYRGDKTETRGTSFVIYEDIYDAKNAVDHLSGFNVCGRYLIVLYYQPVKMQKIADNAAKKKEIEEMRAKFNLNKSKEDL
jgi:RNA recognition motif-containing protein